MALFGPKAKPVVGLDIGSSAAKAVELKKTKSGYELQTIDLEPLSPEAVADGAITDSLAVSSAIEALFTRNKIKTTNVAISVSGPPVITKRITMGLMEADELYDQIRHDAGQYIPFDLADVNLDYQVLGQTPMGDQQEVLLVGVKKAKIADYQRTLSLVPGRKLGLAVVDVDAFALQNAFEANYDPPPDATIALLNIGASVTNINIVRGGVPLFIRDVAVGGNQYTDALQKDFELSWEQAEEAKRGQSVPGVNQEQLASALRGISETLLLLEIQKTFDFFRATAGAEPISQIYVAGGAARTPGLLDLLREEFQMTIEELNPFQRINYNPSRFSDDYIRERAPRLAVSVGLALRSFDEA